MLHYRGHHFSTSQRRRSVPQLFRQRQTLYCSLFFQFPAFPYGRKRAVNAKPHLGHIDARREARRFHRKEVEIWVKSFSRRIDLSAIICLDRNPMREAADHLRGRLIFESSYSRAFQELSDDALEPDVRISRDRILCRIEWPPVCSKKGIDAVSSAA